MAKLHIPASGSGQSVQYLIPALPGNSAAAWLGGGASFKFWMPCLLPVTPTGAPIYAVLQITGLLSVAFQENRLRYSINGVSGTPLTTPASSINAVANTHMVLWGCYDSVAGTLELGLLKRDGSGNVVSESAVASRTLTGVPTAVAFRSAQLSSVSNPEMYAIFMARDGVMTKAEAEAIFETRDFWQFMLKSDAPNFTGGARPSTGGLLIVGGHSLPDTYRLGIGDDIDVAKMFALDYAVAGVGTAVGGSSPTTTQLGDQYDTKYGTYALFGSGAAVPSYIDPADIGNYDDTYDTQLQTVSPDPSEATQFASPKIRAMASGSSAVTGRRRIWVHENSRGIRRTAGGNVAGVYLPPNTGHGLIANILARVGGILVPVAPTNSNRWFGLGPAGANLLTTGTVAECRNTAYRNLCRIGFGSHDNSTSTGPGIVTRVAASSSVRVLIFAEAGSLLTDDDPMDFTIFYDKIPGGCSSVTVQDWTAAAQNTAAVSSTNRGTVGTFDASTPTKQSHTWGASDAYSSGAKTLTLVGVDYTTTIDAGDCVYVSAGTGAGSFGKVASVQLVGSDTVVTLEHTIYNTPGTGATLRFGTYETGTFTYTSAAASGLGRGPLIGTDSSGDLFIPMGIMPEVAGYTVIPLGSSGDGYTLQMNNAFSGNFEAMTEVLDPDMVILGPADQSTSASAMETVRDQMRSAKPDLEIGLIAYGEVGVTQSHGTWAAYLASQEWAPAALPGNLVMKSIEGYSRGHNQTEAHPGALAYENLWFHALAQFAENALPEPGGPGGPLVPGRTKSFRRAFAAA